MKRAKKPPQPGSKPAAAPPDNASPPQPTDEPTSAQDSFGPTPDGVEDDASKPRAIDRQFGAEPAVETERHAQDELSPPR